MKKRVIYLQEDSHSCGAVCIQSVISHYGGYIPLEKILEDTNTDFTGTTAYDLIRSLNEYGFSSCGKRIPLKDISREQLPVIAHVLKNGLEHFVVIYEITSDKVVTMDPEEGEKVYSVSEFLKIYDEKAIFFFKTGPIPNFKVTHTLIKTIRSLIAKHWRAYIVILLLFLYSILASFIGSFHLKILELSTNPYTTTLVFIVARLFTAIVLYIKDFVTTFIIDKIGREITLETIEHVFSLPLKYRSRHKTGEIIKKIENVEFVKDLFLRMSIASPFDLLLATASLLAIISINHKLGVIYLLFSIYIIMAQCLRGNKIYKKSKESSNLHQEYMGTLVENIEGIESIKNTGREVSHIKEISKKLETHMKFEKKMCNYMNRINEKRFCMTDVTIFLTNFIGFAMISDIFTFYDLITVQSLFGLSITSLENLLSTVCAFLQGKALYRSVSEFLDIEEEICVENDFIGSIEEIKIEDLSFSYDGIHENINHFNFHIMKGDKILLKGPSGVGKSTLAKCLCGRFTEIDGKITINGKSIATICPKALRKHIIYVGQEEKLFSCTIEENIAGLEADSKKLAYVIEKTHLKELIDSKPEKEKSFVLEGATNFSGGERSRMVLARALYEEPDVLIIDETLSSVSVELEDDILRELLNIDELTVIYITHREKEYLFDKVINLRKE